MDSSVTTYPVKPDGSPATYTTPPRGEALIGYGKPMMKGGKIFCFDLDGTICETREPGQQYPDVAPIPHMCELVRKLYREGHYVIIYTARNMVTFKANVGLITAHQVPVIQEWLKKHDVPYHELIVGKPHADYFIDDKGVNPVGMDASVLHDILTQ